MGTNTERWEEACPSLAAKLSPKAHTGSPGTACGYGRKASTGRYTDGPTWPVSSEANLPKVEFTRMGASPLLVYTDLTHVLQMLHWKPNPKILMLMPFGGGASGNQIRIR